MRRRLARALVSRVRAEPGLSDYALWYYAQHVRRLALDGAAFPMDELMLVGNIARLQDRYDEAERWYRRALQSRDAQPVTERHERSDR